MKHERLLSLILVVFIFQIGYAQEFKNLKTSFEEAKTKCQNRPLNKRVSILVSRFEVAPPYSSLNFDLGGNMTTILTNGLQEVNCFKVLELRENKDLMIKEIDGDEYMDKSTLPQKGKIQGAQIIVTGKITEFSQKKTNARIRGFNLGGNHIDFGFVLKLVNPETGVILWSKSVNVEGKATGSANMNLNLGRLGPLNLGQGTSQSPAVANALEQGMFSACELLVENINNIELPDVDDPDIKTLTLKVKNTEFMQLRNLSKQLEALNNVKSARPTFSGGMGTCVIKHYANPDDLLDALFNGILDTYEIMNVSEEEIIVATK